MMLGYNYLLVCCVVCVRTVYSQTGTNLKDLHTYLFTTIGYNKDVRPANDQTLSTNVSVELTITGLIGIDEVVQKLTTVGYLTLTWTDDFLQWTPGTYGGISYVEVPQGNIWKPDVHLSNGFTNLQELGGSFLLAKVDNYGNVTWTPYKVFETKCRVDIMYFPFDEQKCKIQFVVWSSSVESVRLSVGSQGITLDDVHPNGEWSIISTSSDSFVDDGESFVNFYITMKRRPLLYIVETVLPVIFLSVLSMATFVLPAESGERMSYSITIFLSFAVFLTIVSASLPDVSDSIPIFSRFLILHLTIDVFVIIVNAFQLRLHHRGDSSPVPKYLITFTNFARTLQCRTRSCCRTKRSTEVSSVDVHELNGKGSDVKETRSERDDGEMSEVSWMDVVSAADFFLCIVLSLILVISSVVVFVLLTS